MLYVYIYFFVVFVLPSLVNKALCVCLSYRSISHRMLFHYSTVGSILQSRIPVQSAVRILTLVLLMGGGGKYPRPTFVTWMGYKVLCLSVVRHLGLPKIKYGGAKTGSMQGFASRLLSFVAHVIL